MAAMRSGINVKIRAVMMDGVSRTAWDVAAILGVARDPQKVYRISSMLSEEYDNGIYSRRTKNKYHVASNTNHWVYTIKHNK